MTTHRFEEVTRPVTKRVPCRVCRKMITRSTILSQTISPFNINDDGSRKTREQIRAELKAQAETWHPHNDIHADCVRDERPVL